MQLVFKSTPIRKCTVQPAYVYCKTAKARKYRWHAPGLAFVAEKSVISKVRSWSSASPLVLAQLAPCNLYTLTCSLCTLDLSIWQKGYAGYNAYRYVWWGVVHSDALTTRWGNLFNSRRRTRIGLVLASGCVPRSVQLIHRNYGLK